jgi:hypothetical protein
VKPALDASILVGEAVHQKGRPFIADDELEVFTATPARGIG